MKGGCRCANLSLDWPGAGPGGTRACRCEYCAGQDAAYASDPSTPFTLTIGDAAQHAVIRHGTGTAEFHQCRTCNDLVCVTWDDEEQRYGVVNTRCLEQADRFERPRPVDFDGEEVMDRLARRRRTWCAGVAVVYRDDAVLNYDRFAADYHRYRQPDPRIGAAIDACFDSGWQVLNVGAGTGGYEPRHCSVTGLEPSAGMLAARERGPGVQGVAESLPFADGAFDASLAILTLHHWTDWQAGLAEMRRVSRRRVVLLTWVGYTEAFWLLDYLPAIRDHDAEIFPTLDAMFEVLGTRARVEQLPVPADCSDGFMCAYWARPEAYLDPGARAAISSFAWLGDIAAPLARLRDDIAGGSWQERYGHLLENEALDMGYRLVIADYD